MWQCADDEILFKFLLTNITRDCYPRRNLLILPISKFLRKVPIPYEIKDELSQIWLIIHYKTASKGTSHWWGPEACKKAISGVQRQLLDLSGGMGKKPKTFRLVNTVLLLFPYEKMVLHPGGRYYKHTGMCCVISHFQRIGKKFHRLGLMNSSIWLPGRLFFILYSTGNKTFN